MAKTALALETLIRLVNACETLNDEELRHTWQPRIYYEWRQAVREARNVASELAERRGDDV